MRMAAIRNDVPNNIRDGAVRCENRPKLHSSVVVAGTELFGAKTMVHGEANYKRLRTCYGELFCISSYRPLCKRRSSCAVLRTEPPTFVQIEGIVQVGNVVFIDVLEFATQTIDCYDPQYALIGVNGITVEHIMRIINTGNIKHRHPASILVGMCVRITDYLVHIPFVHTSAS